MKSKAFLARFKDVRNRYWQTWCAFQDKPFHKYNEKQDRETEGYFLSETNFQKKFDGLFAYFLDGFLLWRGRNKTRSYYSGLLSARGMLVDGFEGFSRFVPLIASWISSGRPHRIKLINSDEIDLFEIIRDAMVCGTDPTANGYWGDMYDFDPRICEAHDIALSFWLLRDQHNALFSALQLQGIADWLYQVNNRQVVDNNWHLFIVIVNLVLKNLGFKYDNQAIVSRFERIKEFHIDSGWFGDGVTKSIDYYNAWAFHYSFYWITRIDPNFESSFIDNSRKNFFKLYRYLITPSGFPAFGRSLTYRTAVSVPHLVSALKNEVSLGEAQNAFCSIWDYFVQHKCLKAGGLNQGFFKENALIVENYCGPASPLWGLRSFVLALQFNEKSDFWTGDKQPLPIEESDFTINFPILNWEIKGEKKSKVVEVIMGNNSTKDKNIQRQRILSKFIGVLLRKSTRPANYQVKYDLHKYSSSEDFLMKNFDPS